jgi:hypothetical protein
MEDILNKYCQKSRTGLLILSMPTGFGKTYNVLNFIYTHYQEFAQQKRKIIFITNLKKNLPIKELEKRFSIEGKQEQFTNHVLLIDSNADTIINNLPKIADQIPEKLQTQNYKKLKLYIEILNNPEPQTILLDMLQKEIRESLEPKFRKSIKRELKEKFSTKKERLNLIKNDKNYQWIGELYPAVFTDEKTVFFLSMDKFWGKNSTIIEDSYYFCEKFIDKALIFIDEFDATKEVVLKQIIASGLKYKVDIVDLFLNIHNHLIHSESSELLIKESAWFKKASAGKNWLSPEKQIASFRQEAKKIFNTYKLQYTCKSDAELSRNKRNFLFYDYQFHNVTNRNQRIEIIPDSDKLTNWIKGCNFQTDKIGVDIHEMLNKITGFLTYFQRGIKHLAENYYHLKQEQNQETFSIEFAVKTVLNDFHIDDQDVEFLTNKILADEFIYNYHPQGLTLENQQFYDTGFRYHDIVDSEEHDTLSKIYMFNFSLTPESFLAKVCEKAMVVGISATASINTNIGNYDIDYLQNRLGKSFISLKDDEILPIQEQYFAATQGYNQVKIKAQFIGTNDQREAIKELEKLFNDKEIAQALYNEFKQEMANDKTHSIEFLVCRYVKVLAAWKYFLDNPDCHAFICFLNKFPKPDDPSFDLKILHEYAQYLLPDRSHIIDDSIEDTIFILNSNNFDDKKDQLIHELKDNKRRFIISTYQTIGVGQNLQFPIPDKIEPIYINNYTQNSYMDINGIYLEKPTHLLVNIYEDKIADDQFIKYIFQLEFMRENGAIALNIFKNKLDAAFQRYIGIGQPKRKAEDFHSLYNTDSYSRFVNRIIIQAIGRICRTNIKAPTIHILADIDIKKHLNRFYLPQNMIVNREYTALLELVTESNRSQDLTKAQNLASNISNRTSAYIRRQLNTPWTPKSIKEWQDLRKQVLLQPAISQESECNHKWRMIYVKLPQTATSYIYSEKYDYGEIEVFFSQNYGKQEIKQVNGKTARLPELMKIDMLRQLFLKYGWITEFPESQLMLTPPIFNNIYKGALGEVCGKHILETYLNIELLELDVNEFEIFDFKTEKNIYIDFKLWNDQIRVPAEDIIKNIQYKMEQVKTEKVLIINILGSRDTGFIPIHSCGGKIIEFPYLCKNGKVDDKAILELKKIFL